MKAIEMRRWTREEYDRLVATGMFAPGERVELVAGEILQMTPQGSIHATVIQLLQEELRKAFGPAFSIRPQLPIALAPDSEPEPDLAVVPGNPLAYWDAHPATALLLVEVSDTTLEHDRQRKGSLYARAGIQDYWIVNLIDRCVEVYREPRQGAYRSCQRFFAGDRLAPLAAPEAHIPVAGIFMRE
jgi:Uma2 family endonuclease